MIKQLGVVSFRNSTVIGGTGVINSTNQRGNKRVHERNWTQESVEDADAYCQSFRLNLPMVTFDTNGQS